MSLALPNTRMFNAKAITDLSGRRYGQLLVEHPSHFEQLNKRGNWTLYWRCACACGNSSLVSSANLQSRHVNSCGCLSRAVTVARNLKHGLNKHGLYGTWKAMRQRCLNPKSLSFKNYGGRGITISAAWDSFETFVQDMAAGYEAGLTLDRRDNDGPYCKENCRWATRKVQANNQRGNVIITHLGQSLTPAQWEAKTGVKAYNIRQRLLRYRWPIEKALGL